MYLHDYPATVFPARSAHQAAAAVPGALTCPDCLQRDHERSDWDPFAPSLARPCLLLEVRHFEPRASASNGRLVVPFDTVTAVLDGTNHP